MRLVNPETVVPLGFCGPWHCGQKGKNGYSFSRVILYFSSWVCEQKR